jgi:hypothetical protein
VDKGKEPSKLVINKEATSSGWMVFRNSPRLNTSNHGEEEFNFWIVCDGKDTFSLVGCMVSPGFEFRDFELFTQEELLQKYQQHREIIMKLAYKQLLE